jgi:hypothetical protein
MFRIEQSIIVLREDLITGKMQLHAERVVVSIVGGHIT